MVITITKMVVTITKMVVTITKMVVIVITLSRKCYSYYNFIITIDL